MNCTHPIEELQRVYEGGHEPRTDRLLCGLCGELVYARVGYQVAGIRYRSPAPMVSNR